MEKFIKLLEEKGQIASLQRTLNRIGDPPTKDDEIAVAKHFVVMAVMMDKELKMEFVKASSDLFIEELWKKMGLKAGNAVIEPERTTRPSEGDDMCEGCHGCDEEETSIAEDLNVLIGLVGLLKKLTDTTSDQEVENVDKEVDELVRKFMGGDKNLTDMEMKEYIKNFPNK